MNPWLIDLDTSHVPSQYPSSTLLDEDMYRCGSMMIDPAEQL